MTIVLILQSLIDISIVGLGLSYLIQRRRLLALEHQLRLVLSRLNDSGVRDAAVEPTANPNNFNTPLGSAISTLSERRASITDSDTATLSSAGRYSLAQKLLAEGHSLGEVAKRTSISQTELVLLKKLSQNSALKNYDSH